MDDDRPHKRIPSHYTSRYRSGSPDRRHSDKYLSDRTFFIKRQENRESRPVRIWPKSPSRSISRSPTPPPSREKSEDRPEFLEIEEESKSSGHLAEARREKSYGTNMLPGEGLAIASYVTSGSRIPRRGEVGIDAGTISKFESSGYVMSGSRHAAMNAVRLRKENQVLSVEGKRQAVLEAIQEKKKREEEIVHTLKKLINEKKLRNDQ